MKQQEKIGRCEVCGIVDHHLVGGLCPGCRPRIEAVDVRIAGRKRGARIAGRLRIEYDSAKNPMIRLLPAGR